MLDTEIWYTIQYAERRSDTWYDSNERTDSLEHAKELVIAKLSHKTAYKYRVVKSTVNREIMDEWIRG